MFLSKNGKDITLEATVDGVVLRTLNDAKNAFAAVHFHRGEDGLTPHSGSLAAACHIGQSPAEFFDDFRPPDVTQKSKFMAKVASQRVPSAAHERTRA